MKFPILLPKGHVFTKLVVFKAHCDVFHGGVRETLAEVRQRFWIPQERRVIRSNIRNCVTCLKINGKPYESSDPPPLPSSRIAEGLPFQYTGVDFSGPLLVKGNPMTRMVYICLFTCAVIRAVHLEIGVFQS